MTCPRTSTQRGLTALLCASLLASTGLAQNGSSTGLGGNHGGITPRAQSPYAVEIDATHHALWMINDYGVAAQLELPSLRFLDIDLMGYADVVRLRMDLPHDVRDDTPAEHVVLPGGGSLYRVQLAASSAILHVRADGGVRLHAITPDIAGVPSLQEELSVSGNGRYVLVATNQAAGGDVLRLDLRRPNHPRNLTAGIAPLVVIAESLRCSEHAAFFLADSTVWRATPTSTWLASEVLLPLLAEEEVEPESVLSNSGHVLAILARSDDDEGRYLAIHASGPVVVVTPTPDAYDLPKYDHPLGPFVAISPIDHRLGFRTNTDGAADELFIADIVLAGNPEHLTAEPVFPAYVDNVGVFAFSAPDLFCFFAGDVQLSGLDPEEMIGSGEMYMADVADLADISFINVTRTNGHESPPFTDPGTLRFSAILMDPLGKRFFLMGEGEDDSENLYVVRIDGVSSGPNVPNLTLLLEGQDEDSELWSAGAEVLYTGVPEEESNPNTNMNVYHMPSLAAGGVPVLLANIPDAEELQARSGHPSGTIAALSAIVANDDHLLLCFDLQSNQVQAPLGADMGSVHSGQLSYTPMGRLYIGIGAHENSMAAVAIEPQGLSIQSLVLPPGAGFPLAR